MSKDNHLPRRFVAHDGSIWVLFSEQEKKAYRQYPTTQDETAQTRFRRFTRDEARAEYEKTLRLQTNQPEPEQSTATPPNQDKSDEPIAADSVTEEAEPEQHTQPHRPHLFGMTDEEANDLPDFEQEEERQDDHKEPEPEPQKSRTDRTATDTEKHLANLLERERALADAATRPVVFTPSLISRNDVGIIGRGTINIIQGAYGSHKSRLAELIGALILARDPDHPQFIDFVRAKLERFCLAYIDTERNQREELPFAIQEIKRRAGYSLSDQPAEFRFTSIKAIRDRKDRFPAIEAYINQVRATTALHLFCIIDVVTDAGGDFNDPKEAMKLLDFLGVICDEHDATFLAVIHQNPGTDKARGHTGTEAANKASSVLQIGFEKDANGNDTDLIRLKYLKLRRGKRPEPVYLTFCKESNGLILADPASVAAHVNHRNHKADSEDIADRLVSLLSKGALPKKEVWTILESEFKASNATIRGRLKSIMTDPPAMFDEQGCGVVLGEYSKGRDQFYRLNPVE